MNRQYIFTIAGITLCFQTELAVKMTEGFQPFCSEKKPEYVVRFCEVEELNPFPRKWVYKGRSYAVALDGCGEYRRMFFDAKRAEKPYAIARYDWADKQITVEYLPEKREYVSAIDSCFFHIAWESLLMHEQRIMLHASCVDTPYGGMLFSGPSGIGKSTQAELWCRFGGGRLLNGDRVVISHVNKEWLGYGSPYAGSSRCYVNESCPIAAIIILKQGSSCSIRRLGTTDGFRGIFSGLTVNSWDRKFVEFACNFAETAAGQLPVYELTCTPDENAVRILENKLKESAQK